MPISTIEEGLEEIRNGRIVVLVDEDAPDSDGFFCLAAEKVRAQSINYMMHHGRGIIYVTLTDERIRELGIPMIPEENSPLGGLICGASFSVSLEGVHGVSAQGRAHTIQAAIADHTKHEDLVIPGHVQPLQARSGGVLARSGLNRQVSFVKFWMRTGPSPCCRGCSGWPKSRDLRSSRWRI
jgi:3,4-dihydroxy 2-butanone 4-phosphate synthase/GTP cyclohydrolase II